ncbi:DUF1194 domain-containing protein [Aliigemmobacter aestuarii]|uniref:DUF1194 domain-containing protein n=1 Tax=Aliigemmobacter aestuarii TaxID=1445661 RepID=A0A4S3MLE4_9RHOB|nr:DUF1194 domain-containing protein [Gemmobacter aestuarii]THD82400.1 DUF1194 domain-containing protein [Gemmobacter aestuarii]
MMRALVTGLCLMLPALDAKACETALLLAIDVSGSIDAGEYALQVQGLAAALEDPEVAEILQRGQVALSVVQWSGTGLQSLVVPWRRMRTPADVAGFATTARSLPRAFDGSDTAVGEAVGFATAQFAQVPDCRRHVIDISGDGPENAGFTIGQTRAQAIRQGIEINAIAIEDMGVTTPIAAFYRKWVISPKGFVIVARGLEDYPRAIREKLIRELSKPVG